MLKNCPIADRFTSRVHSAAIDQAQRLTIPALVRELQSAAMRNSVRLGFSVFELQQQQLGWVLLRQRLDLNHRPKLEETFEVLTCPAGFDRFFTYRDFHLYDQQGSLFGTVSSAWMMFDLQSRKMTAVPAWIREKVEPYLPEGNQLLPRPDKLRRTTHPQPDQVLDFRVGYHQLDFNGHLSNPFYLEWGLEALPQVVLSKGELIGLEIEYKKEAVFGQAVRVAAALEEGIDGTYNHHITNEAGETLAQMRTNWR